MRKALMLGVLWGAIGLGALGWWAYQEQMTELPLAPEVDLWEKPNPEGDQDLAEVEVLLPKSPAALALLRNQSLEPLVEQGEKGWTGLLAEAAWRSHHAKHWRFKLRPGLRFQDGRPLDAATLVATFPHWAPRGLRADLKMAQVVDGAADFRFLHAQPGVAEALAAAPVVDPVTGLGTGPFLLSKDGTSLVRSGFFRQGRAGLQGLRLVMDPEALEGGAWAQGLEARRWAFAHFPGQVPPEAMARVRLTPYDEVRLADGSVWFISRRLRRFRPDPKDWAHTRFFGVWRADYELARKGE